MCATVLHIHVFIIIGRESYINNKINLKLIKLETFSMNKQKTKRNDHLI